MYSDIFAVFILFFSYRDQKRCHSDTIEDYDI
jgi:hypothetical protein